MKQLGIGLLIATAMLGTDSAHAREARPATPDWTGVYLGLHAGWSVADAQGGSQVRFGADPLYTPQRFGLGDTAPLFGAQAGVNWQIRNWVVGLEADATATGVRGFDRQVPVVVLLPGGPVAAVGGESFLRQEVDWLASLRGRLGHAFGPGLAYLTAGVALARVNYQANITDAFILCADGCAWPARFSRTQAGWALGAGYEWAAASNWTLRLEYLAYGFGGARAAASTPACPTCSASFQWDDLTIHTVRFGVNYRWGGAVAPHAQPAVVDWSGPYAGIHGGLAPVRGTGQSTTTVDVPPTQFFAPATFDLSDNGPLLGGQVGYNWRRAGWVFGIEADLSVLSSHSAQSQAPACAVIFGCAPGTPVSGAASLMRQDVNWLAGLRGRIGHVWGPGLVYVTGGAAFAHVGHRAETVDGRQVCGLLGCAFPADVPRIRSGWALGGGAEWPIWSNWTLRGEYLFHRFAGVETTAAVTPATLCMACAVTYRWNDLDLHVLRVGLNYTW